MLWWLWRMHDIDRKLTDGDVNMSDYSVHVMGLPEDATEQQVRAHFDRLYNLRKPDWVYESSCAECFCNRKIMMRRQFKGPKLASTLFKEWVRARSRVPRRGGGCCGAEAALEDIRSDASAPVSWQDWATCPVLNAANTGQQEYLRSWVAEVTLVHPNGGLLRRYKALQKLRDRQMQARAAVKVYSNPKWVPGATGGLCCGAVEVHVDRSCAGGPLQLCYVRSGPREARLAATRQRLAAIESRLHKLDLKHARSINSSVIGAFVVFNNEESWRRCLYDYQVSQRWYFPVVAACRCHRTCQAPPLWFENKHPLIVHRAPAPTDVIWENLEVPGWERALRISLANLCMLLFLAASLVGIVLAQQQQEAFRGTLPSQEVCTVQAPTVAWGVNPAPLSEVFQVRGTAEQDAACSAQFGGDHIFLWWGGASAPPTPSAPFPAPPTVNITDADGSVLNTVTNTCSGPCLPADISNTSPCVVPKVLGAEPSASQTFPVRAVIGCYCLQRMRSLLMSEDTSWSDFRTAVEQEATCQELASSFVLAQVLIFVAAAGVVLINTSLKSVLWRATKQELHTSVAALKSAVASKLFLALFLNTGLIVLLVHARIPGAESLPLGVLRGAYSSFSPGWYSTAGAAVTLTMIINIAAPHALPLGKYCCVYPCKRRCCSKSAILQRELNDFYKAPEFEVESRVPHVMNTVVVTLLYSSGIPLLLPVAAVSLLTTYLVDVFLLSTFYAQPPPLNASMAQLAFNIMPFALMAHSAFAIWFYGDDATVESDPVLLGDAGGVGVQDRYQAAVASVEHLDPIGLAPKVLRQNVFPMFVLFLSLAGGLLLFVVVRAVASALLARFVYILTCGACCTGIREVNAKLNPPFTQTYEHRLPLNTKYTLTPEQSAKGFCLIKDVPRHKTAISRVRKYSAKTPISERCSKDRLLMLTWEVIKARTGLASYAMTANPKYAQAVLALQEGAVKAEVSQARAALQSLAAVMGGAHPQPFRMSAGRRAAYSLHSDSTQQSSPSRGKGAAKRPSLTTLALDDSDTPTDAGTALDSKLSAGRNPSGLASAGGAVVSPGDLLTPGSARGAMALAFHIDDSVAALHDTLSQHNPRGGASGGEAGTGQANEVAHADDGDETWTAPEDQLHDLPL